jgi:hypothetical protein
METFSDGDAPVSQGLAKRLSDVFGMNMVNCLQAEVWQRQLFTPNQRFEYCRIEMTRWVQRVPPRPDNVSRMQNCYRETVYFWIPYSPNGLRGCSSVVGTTTLGP